MPLISQVMLSQTQFLEVTKQKKLIRTQLHVLMEINSKQKHILLRNKVLNNGGSLKQIVIEKDFSSGQY